MIGLLVFSYLSHDCSLQIPFLVGMSEMGEVRTLFAAEVYFARNVFVHETFNEVTLHIRWDYPRAMRKEPESHIHWVFKSNRGRLVNNVQ